MKGSEREEALLIDCEGEKLLGILHVPASETMQNTAVIMVPAGQLQYRAGCGRQLVDFARRFSERGFPALRFDLRGAGDSSGDYLGLQHMGAELESVINTLTSVLPNVEKVVLWGGCEAASGIMIFSWQHPEVTGWILSNPYIRSQEIQDAAQRRHYLRRVRDREFWVKLFTGKYNLLGYAKATLSRVGRKLASLFGNSSSQKGSAAQEESEDFMQRMLQGAGKFRGRALMVMSGNSMISSEFDILLEQSNPWRTTFGVEVTGAVDDVRPYLQHAIASCLPLRIGRGIQNKALEALSMELPVLATPEALTGIVDVSSELIAIAADADRMKEAALTLLEAGKQVNRRGRELVLEQFDWDANLKKLEARLLATLGGAGSPT